MKEIKQKPGQIIPVEVKASAGGALKSLFYFAREKKWNQAIRLSLKPYGVENLTHSIQGDLVQVRLTNVPLYAAERIMDFTTLF